MRLELTEAQMEFLRGLLSEESERARDHLDWLQSAAAHAEEDKERQTAESERSIEMADQLLAVLDGNGGQKRNVADIRRETAHAADGCQRLRWEAGPQGFADGGRDEQMCPPK